MSEPCTYVVSKESPLTFAAIQQAKNQMLRDMWFRKEAARFIRSQIRLEVMVPPRHFAPLEVAPPTPYERNVAAWNRMCERSQP